MASARILVVEPDAALAAILHDVLAGEGWEITLARAAPPDPDEPSAAPPFEASEAEATRAAIVSGEVDAIVADLPLDGLRALRAVQRRATEVKPAPVVALVTPTISPRALRPLGLDVELRLPLDLAMLVEAVRRVLVTGPVAIGANGPIVVDEPTPSAIHVLAGHLASIAERFPALVGRVRELAAGTADEAAVEESLRSASRAAAKAEGFAQYLRALAMDVSDTEGPTDVRRVIGFAMQIALGMAKERARVEKQLAEAPLVWCVEAALVRVFVELLVNAASAIPRGAPERHTIAIATGTDDDGNACVTISDDGVGMSAEVLARVFEPFYTTRRQGGGVGLGLSLCRDAITELGGALAIESAPGSGTRVQVTLPPASARHRKNEPGRA